MSNEPPDDQATGPAAGGQEPTARAAVPDFTRVGRHAAPPSSNGATVAPPTPDQRRASRRARHRQVAPRSRRRAALVGLLGAFVVVLGLLIGATTFETRQLDANVTRIDNVFPAESESESGSVERPAEPAGDSLTFLVAGVEQVPGSDRPLLDTVLLMHATDDRSQAQVVAVPVDTWVPGAGGTPAEGYRDGGPAGLVGSVEALSDVRVDNYVELDFEGFQQVIDDLGGVGVDVPQVYANRGYDFPVGRQRLDGTAALAYIRDVGPSSRGTAAVRQQAVITAVFNRVRELGALSDVGTLTGLLGTVTDAVSVDETVGDADLVSLVWDLRGVGQPAFLSLPVSGTGEEAGRDVKYVDGARATALWGHLEDDTLGEHLDEFR